MEADSEPGILAMKSKQRNRLSEFNLGFVIYVMLGSFWMHFVIFDAVLLKM